MGCLSSDNLLMVIESASKSGKGWFWERFAVPQGADYNRLMTESFGLGKRSLKSVSSYILLLLRWFVSHLAIFLRRHVRSVRYALITRVPSQTACQYGTGTK